MYVRLRVEKPVIQGMVVVGGQESDGAALSQPVRLFPRTHFHAPLLTRLAPAYR